MLRTDRRSRALVRPTIAAVAALTALAAALRFIGIGHQGFWFDEANTVLLVHVSPGQMLGLIPRIESTPPLYYCIAWVWAHVFGSDQAGLRSLSALTGIATVPVAYAAGAKLISRRVGVVAAALTACNPLLIWYSQEARSYSLLVLLSGLSLLAFAYALERPTQRTLVLWGLAAALALATHYYALLVIAPQAIWLLVAHRRERAVQIAIAAVGLCGLALIPLALSQNSTGHTNWIAPMPLGPRLGQVSSQFLIGFGSPGQGVLAPLAAAIVIGALALLLFRAEEIERRRALAVGAIAVGGLVLNLLLVAGGFDDLITRNVIMLWLPAALLVAGGLGARRAGLLGIAGATALCVIGIVAAIGVASERNLQRPDWQAVARALGPGPAPGAPPRAILVQRYRELLPLSLYLHGLKFWPHHGTPTVSELDIVSISSPHVSLCWWGSACNLVGSRMQSSYPIPGFHPLWRRLVLQFTILRLVSPTPVALTPAMVSAALTTTKLRRDEFLIQR